MKIGIVQPARIGDIIILLPAAKRFSDKGYKVLWPIFSNYVKMFTEVVDYVEFVGVNNNVYTAVPEAYRILKEQYKVDTIYDVAATFPGSVVTEEYDALGGGVTEPFDVFKYRKLGIDIAEKWKLVLNRNILMEDQLFSKYAPAVPYDLINLNCSSGTLAVDLGEAVRPRVIVNEEHSLFYWLKLMENAHTLVLSDSSMAVLADQLCMNNNKVMYRRPISRLPVLKSKWDMR